MSVGKVVYTNSGKRTCFIDGEPVSEAEYDRRFPSRLDLSQGLPFVPGPNNWPMKSVGLAVTPRQVAEANMECKRRGIDAVYDKKGMAHIANRSARAKLIKMRGAFDQDGGYSD